MIRCWTVLVLNSHVSAVGGHTVSWDGTVVNVHVPWKISLLVPLWWQSAPFVCCYQTSPQGCTGHKPHAPNLNGQLSSTNHINQSHQPYMVTYCIAGNFRGRKLSQISRFCNCLRNFSPWIGGRGMIHYKQYQVAMPFGFNFMGLIYCYPGKSLCSCSNETITAVRNFPMRWCQKISLK